MKMIRQFFVVVVLMAACVSFTQAQFVNTGNSTNSNIWYNGSGNVGIGTNNPDKKLTIKGELGFYRLNDNPTTVSAGYMSYYNNHLTLGINSNDPTNGIRFETTSGKLARLVIRNDGNVGIGEETPNERLVVKDGLIRIDVANTQDNNSPGLVALSNDDFTHTASGKYLNRYGFGFFQFGSNPQRHAYMSGFFGLHFFTGSNESRMTINQNGQVGIGVTNFDGDFKLYVDGGIRIRNAKVDLSTAWGDYVFETTYKLPTLSEVEAYIKANKHLPGVPSAATLEKEGLDLGEMQKTQMVKIEELTLYTIQLKKENDALKQKMKKYESLAKRLEKLEKILEKK
ncbi:hypothetical protein BKI52_27265 [marine bacterium AO1-C]|nr:hypothetical protein BKI52_27265 [marine bacterium AO1-C]